MASEEANPRPAPSRPRTVGEIMRRDFATVPAQQRLSEALGIMRLGRLRHLVVEREGQLAGILTYRDLQDREIDRLAATPQRGDPSRELPVEEAMMESPYVVTPDTPLTQAAARMSRLRVGCLPVVEPGPSGGHLVGLLTEADLLAAAYAQR